jgi:hypothetical protein
VTQPEPGADAANEELEGIELDWEVEVVALKVEIEVEVEVEIEVETVVEMADVDADVGGFRAAVMLLVVV